MRREVVRWENGTVKAELEVGEATVRMGMRRARLRLDGGEETEDRDVELLRKFRYPDLMGGTVHYRIETGEETYSDDGRELTFEAYLELPDGLDDAWGMGVYRMNPAWLPGHGDAEAEHEEKKENRSSSTAG